MLRQDLAVASDDAIDVRLQLGVNRGLNAGRPESPALASTISTKCGAPNGGLTGERQPLRPRLPEVAPRSTCPRLHPLEDDALTRHRRVARAVGIESGRPLRQARQKRSLRRREHRHRTTEVRATGALSTHDLIAVRRKVQVERQDLALRKTMLDSQREHGFVNLRGNPAPPSRRLAWLSSSLATCCEIVEPPSTTRSARRSRFRARSIAIGSMPGCDQNLRSSAAIVADTSGPGMASAANATFRVPSPDSASYRGTPRRSTTDVEVMARSSSRSAGTDRGGSRGPPPARRAPGHRVCKKASREGERRKLPER